MLSLCKQYEVFQLKLSTILLKNKNLIGLQILYVQILYVTSVLDDSEWFCTEERMAEEGNLHVRKVTGVTLCGTACQGLAGVGTGDRETNAHVLLMDYALHGQQNKKWGFNNLGGRKWSNERLGKMEQNKGEKPVYLKWKTAQSNGCRTINSAVMVWLWTLGPKHLIWFGRKALADVNYNALT